MWLNSVLRSPWPHTCSVFWFGIDDEKKPECCAGRLILSGNAMHENVVRIALLLALDQFFFIERVYTVAVWSGLMCRRVH